MNNKGYNALDILFKQCNYDVREFEKLLFLKEECKAELLEMIKNLENGSFSTTKEKGDALEKLTKTMFEKLKLFETYPNIHTSTNEIDFLCSLNKEGLNAKGNGLIDFEDDFIIECKNYESPVGVTHVGKFITLMQSQNKNFGMFISKKSITGTGWSDAHGLIKKIYLKYGIIIIDFNINDFKRIANGKSFFEIITNKKFDLINDTEINKYLEKHPSLN